MDPTGPATSTLSYDAAAELSSLRTVSGGTTTKNLTLSYNADGDRTGQSDSVSGSSSSYGYDQADRLITATTGLTESSYAYDGDGLRQSKTVSGTTTQQTWDTAEGLPKLVHEGSTRYLTGPDGLPTEQIASDGTVPYYYHVWAESTRYGLQITESPRADEQRVWIAGGTLHHAPAETFYPLLNEAIARFCHDAHAVFERPHDPLFKPEAIAAIDGQSVRDRLDTLHLSAETSALLNGLWASACSAPIAEAGLSVPLRWFALSGWDGLRMLDADARYKLVAGTRRLIEAMVADGRPDIQLSSLVAAVTQEGDGATVSTREGQTFSARAVVVSVPLNALRALAFSPPLSVGKQAAIAEGQASRGVKVWIRVRGELPHFSGTAPDDYGLTSLHSEVHLPGATLLAGFGPAADRLDLSDREAVARAVRAFLPKAEVEEVGGHDWVADEFSRGTWPVYRPWQLTRYLRALRQSEGRVFLAGSELANGWCGFIDGAIESGLTAARRVAELLSAGTSSGRGA